MFSEKKITVCNKADYYRCRNRKIHMIQLMPHRVLITVIFWYRNEDLPFNGSNTGSLQIGGLQISVSECMKNRVFFLFSRAFFVLVLRWYWVKCEIFGSNQWSGGLFHWLSELYKYFTLHCRLYKGNCVLLFTNRTPSVSLWHFRKLLLLIFYDVLTTKNPREMFIHFLVNTNTRVTKISQDPRA